MNLAEPKRIFPLAVALLSVCMATPALPADEFRLQDGRVIVGRPSDKGASWEIATRDGLVVVPKTQILRRTEDKDLREKLAREAAKAGDSMFAQLQLAQDACRYGLERELWQHLDKALQARASVDAAAAPGLDRRLHEFLGQLEPELLPVRYRGQKTEVRVQQLLAALAGDGSPGRAAAIEELLVREPGADQELRRQARANGTAARRLLAVQALHRRPLLGNDRFVLRTTILDGTEAVRTAAAALARPTVDANAIGYLGAGLMHRSARMRVRTAEALGELGHPDAVKLLVAAGPHAGTAAAAGDGAEPLRAHVAFVQQQAYIRDFDVEVAQASFIADPKVDVLQSGSVLDVGVVNVVEVRTTVRAYRAALQRLTNSDPGENPRQWAAWLASRTAAQPGPTTGR